MNEDECVINISSRMCRQLDLLLFPQTVLVDASNE